MTDNKKERNLDPERIEQNTDNETAAKNEFNTGGNASDYDGGHPADSDPESDGSIDSGEQYARRQHGKDEIEDKSFNEGDNDSDYDGGHPKDGSN